MREREPRASNRRRAVWRAAFSSALGVCTLLHAGAGAQVAGHAPREPASPPRTAEAVTRAIGQSYLTEDERRALRVNHGLWEDEDMEVPAARARAALMRGALDDASLRDGDAPAIVRAEAAITRGDIEDGLALIKDDGSAHAIVLRALALMGLGRAGEADAALEPLVERLKSKALAEADDVVDGARALMLRAQVRGASGAGGGEFQEIMGLLAHTRETLDKLSWSARAAEGRLLYDKCGYEDAVEALQSSLSFNPSAAETWVLLGQAMVDSFDFERAEGVATRLDLLAAAGDASEEEVAGSSAFGAMILARARLRQGDVDDAIRLLDAQLARFPRMRPLLALRAAASAATYDFAECDRRLAEFDALSPGSPEGVYEVGRLLAGLRQYEEAATYLGEAAKRAPNDPDPIIDLGLLQMQSGRDDDALTALESASRLDSFNKRASNSLVLARELRTFADVRSEHFIVRFKPGDDEILAKEMLPVLEHIHARVTGNGPGGIDHVPPHKTVVELMPNHRWFAVRITGMPKLHTIAAATGPVIAMEAPRLGPGHTAGPYDWARVVQHEFTHTVTLSRTKNRLPHWFTEAGAVYLEDHPRDYDTIQLLANAYGADKLFTLDTINLGFVRPAKPTDRPLAYAQGHWMYEYIIERFGPRAPLDLMDLYATGVREPEAFRRILTIEREDFLREFKEWAGGQLLAWGMRLRDGVPSVKDLVEREAAANANDEQRESEPTPDLIEKWLLEFPDHPELLKLAISARLIAHDNTVTADLVPLLERYAAARPVDPLPHRLLARYYLEGDASRAAEAIPHLEWLDQREQHQPTYAVELARRYADLKDWDHARASAERAAGIAPYDAPTREFAATIALRAGDEPAAERHIRALIVLEPDRPIHAQRLEALLKRRAK